MFEEKNIKKFVSELALITGFSDNLVEKDVWQKLVLQKLYSDSEIRRNLVFKGGTCITRTLLGYYRFSEDLDFGWRGKEGRNFYSEFSRLHLAPLAEIGIRAGKHYGTLGGRLMKWDLSCHSSKLVLSVNFSHGNIFQTQDREISTIKIGAEESRRLNAVYPDIFSEYYSPLAVPCHSAEEIACEKFAAIFTRRDLAKPRDIVDLFYLGKIVNLDEVSQDKRAIQKISLMVRSAPAYFSLFSERKKDVPAYLAQLADGALLERELYIILPSPEELHDFASRKLGPILERIAGGIR